MAEKYMPGAPTKASKVRQMIGHPVVDADAHIIETGPVFQPFFDDYVRKFAGEDMVKRFRASGGFDYDEKFIRPWQAKSWHERRAQWVTKPTFWGLPTASTIDRATAHLPKLMHERLPDLGMDFAVVYPTRHILAAGIPVAEMRQVACRAINAYNAEIFKGYEYRLTPVALIPMHTPQEALAELDHAVGELGFKAIAINTIVLRPVGQQQDDKVMEDKPTWSSTGVDMRIDTLGIDKEYDYDVVWRRCIELGVAPASHSASMGWGSRRSISSYVHNHIGHFAAAMEATTRSLWLDGVTHRFPELPFALLEGGVTYGCQLFADFLEHWEKRNKDEIHHLDPKNIDNELMIQLFGVWGDNHFNDRLPGLVESWEKLEPKPEILDEFEAMGIERLSDIPDSFIPNFYFGCEADDIGIAHAFNSNVNPFRAKFRAMFSSDIGHWDVPVMEDVLPETYGNVVRGLITKEDFKDFTFSNAVKFYSSLNPNFFKGTAVEEEARPVIDEARSDLKVRLEKKAKRALSQANG